MLKHLNFKPIIHTRSSIAAVNWARFGGKYTLKWFKWLWHSGVSASAVIVTEKTNILLRYLHQQWDKKVSLLFLVTLSSLLSSMVSFRCLNLYNWFKKIILKIWLICVFQPHRTQQRKGNRNKVRVTAQHPPGRSHGQTAKRWTRTLKGVECECVSVCT